MTAPVKAEWSTRPWLLLLAALTALRLFAAAAMPLSGDEAYYWVWSKTIQPGYLDHPPMVALWIRLGTIIAGDGAIGVRLLAPFSAALGSILLARAAESLRPGSGLPAAALLNGTLLLNAGALTMTPDTPLLFFWTVALWAMARLVATGRAAWWLAAGAAIGCAALSKYTAALFPLAVGAWVLLVPAARRWLARPGPYLAALLAAVVFAPVIAWNWMHGWASFVRQGGRAGDWQPARGAQFLAELVAGQLGLATPWIFALLVLGMWRLGRVAWRDRQPPAVLVLALVCVPLAVFVQHALGDRVQANWPAVVLPASCIAAGWSVRRWRAAALSGLGLSVLVVVQAIWAPLPLPRRLDVTLARLGGWHGWAAQVEAARVRTGAAFVASEEYGDAAILARDLPGGVAVVGAEPRWRLFRLPPAAPREAARTGLLVRSLRRGDPSPGAWATVEPAGEVTRTRGGVDAKRYRLYRVTLPADRLDAVLLPRPD